MKKLFTLWGLMVLSYCAIAQVQVTTTDVIDGEISASYPRPNSVTHQMTYSPLENRYILIVFMGEFISVEDQPTAITYGGVSATKIFGTDASTTSDKTGMAVFAIKGTELDAANIALGSTNTINITWLKPTASNNDAYFMSVLSYRYVSQADLVEPCLLYNTGNQVPTNYTCPTPVLANKGDLVLHLSLWARANNIPLSPTSPVSSNDFLGNPTINKALPTGLSDPKQFIGTVWTGEIQSDNFSYSPLFNRISDNPGRWIVAARKVPYQAVYQPISGKIWFDGNGNRVQDGSEGNASDHYVIAVYTNGPDAGKIAEGGVADVQADGTYSMNVKANQVKTGVDPWGADIYENPTFEINIVSFVPAEGAAYASPAGGSLGAPAGGFNGYYVTNPSTSGGMLAGPYSVIGRYTVTAASPFTPVADQNAGLQSPPTTDVVSTTLPMRPVGTFFELDNSDQLLSGADFEDGGVLQTGATFRILSNPTVVNGIVIKLAYDVDGNGISLGEIINASADPDDNVYFDIVNYDPARLWVYFESGTGSYMGSFTYTAVDAAGAVSPSPQLYSFDVVLPITGLQLNGSYNSAKANLRWKAQFGDDVERYILERSSNGSAFTQVASMQNSGVAYDYTDELGTFNGSDVYYRVRVVRKNGGISYSNVVALKLETIRGLQLAPTLVNSDLQVRFNNGRTQDVIIRVVNVSGQVVMTNRSMVNAGNASINLSGFDRLANGSYTVQVFSGSAVQQGKILVQH